MNVILALCAVAHRISTATWWARTGLLAAAIASGTAGLGWAAYRTVRAIRRHIVRRDARHRLYVRRYIADITRRERDWPSDTTSGHGKATDLEAAGFQPAPGSDAWLEALYALELQREEDAA
jgi:hypothetical protein